MARTELATRKTEGEAVSEVKKAPEGAFVLDSKPKPCDDWRGR